MCIRDSVGTQHFSGFICRNPINQEEAEMGRQSQRKGAAGEKELAQHLRRAGYSVSWGGNRTFGKVPDVSGLPGIHIECKRVEQLNLVRAVKQAVTDASRFQDGAPTVFHRRNSSPWLVTMPVSYTHLDVYKRQGRTSSHTEPWAFRRLTAGPGAL